MQNCELSLWTPERRAEPLLRIGVVLPSDGMDRVGLIVPASGYELRFDGRGAGKVAAGSAEVVSDGARVRWRAEGFTSEPAEVLTLAPLVDQTLERGSGLLLRDLVTGRGFHWQKRMDFSFSGAVEFRVCSGRLLVVSIQPLESYLAGVITAEMSGACPLEFLKSQILVARAWVLAHTEDKHPGLPIDRCNDDCCQRYQGTTYLTPSAIRAAAETRGQVVFHAGGGIIDANYSKSCGGIIEAPEYLWGVSKPGQRAAVDAPAGSAVAGFLPVTEANISAYVGGGWLKQTDGYCSPNVVPDDALPRYLGGVDDGGGYFRWRVSYERAQLEQLLRAKHFSSESRASAAELGTLTNLRPLRRGESGRIIDLAVDYLDPSGRPQAEIISDQYHIREVLHEKFLYSSAFDVQIERDSNGGIERISLRGAGWGHGAGLCQIGALGMALQGHTAEEIVAHYFADVAARVCY